MIVLLSMIFFHIIDDYYLQGILAKLKQRIWWIHNYPNKKYESDYLMALFEHAFSWSFMISIPAAIFLHLTNGQFDPLFWLFFLNVIIHAIIDELKCNEFCLNLVQDQTLHLIQIIFTWYCVVL